MTATAAHEKGQAHGSITRRPIHPPPGRETQVRTSRPGTDRKEPPMRQIRISKHQRPATWWQEPLPPDARAPDIVRAKQLARRARPPRLQPLHRRAAGR